MPQPEGGPATVEKIKVLLKITDDADDAELDDIVDAVNEYVRGLPIAQGDAENWPSRIMRGADMLGARLFRRKNSPSGVEAFSADGAVYVSRNDPDIGMLLQLGRNAKPGVG
jgi:hypothetical protein